MYEVPEASLVSTEHGLVPRGEGWYVVNARESRWFDDLFGRYTGFEGDVRFPVLGINIGVLDPGQPACMYHGESNQEDFLVLSGECLLLVEGEERQLRAWDFFHSPAWTEHVLVGAGNGLCVILAVGALDACINYKTEDIAARLKQTCPKGIDVYFDNVGGDILDAVLAQINQRARIVLCGAISMYNATDLPPGPKNYVSLIIHRARMEGFIITDFLPRFPEAFMQISQWIGEGKIKYAVDVVQGLENATTAINRLFTGANTGKLLVQISEEPK